MPNYEMNYYDYGLTLSSERNMEPVLKYDKEKGSSEILKPDPTESEPNVNNNISE